MASLLQHLRSGWYSWRHERKMVPQFKKCLSSIDLFESPPTNFEPVVRYLCICLRKFIESDVNEIIIEWENFAITSSAIFRKYMPIAGALQMRMILEAVASTEGKYDRVNESVLWIPSRTRPKRIFIKVKRHVAEGTDIATLERGKNEKELLIAISKQSCLSQELDKDKNGDDIKEQDEHNQK